MHRLEALLPEEGGGGRLEEDEDVSMTDDELADDPHGVAVVIDSVGLGNALSASA